jgi:hypothetical protein
MSNEIQIIMPAGAMGASEFDDVLDSALRAIAVAASTDPGGEWAEKYGTAFENDEFMMHPYCWCEEDECPWCGGCAEDFGSVEHAEACYQTVLHAREMAAGVHYSQPWNIRPGNGEYERKRAIQDAIYDRLVEEFGVSRIGCAVHCTCGASEAFMKRIDECQCDWHLGKGQFALGGPNQQAPNFWHKPSGLQVRWYKYIGRGVETDGEPPTDLVARCLASLDALAPPAPPSMQPQEGDSE